MIAPVILNAGSVRSVTVIWATALLLASLYFASGLVEAGKTETDASGDKAWMEQAGGDIACDVCGQVATHIWASLVNAWSTHSGHGDYVREKGPAEMAREMLKDVCDAESYSSGNPAIDYRSHRLSQPSIIAAMAPRAREGWRSSAETKVCYKSRSEKDEHK